MAEFVQIWTERMFTFTFLPYFLCAQRGLTYTLGFGLTEKKKKFKINARSSIPLFDCTNGTDMHISCIITVIIILFIYLFLFECTCVYITERRD